MTTTSTDPIASFIEYHGSYNNVTGERLHRQERLLREFEDRIGVPITDATSEALAEFLESEVRRTSAANVVWQRGALRPFFKWAWRNNLITAEQLMRIEDVPAPRGYRNTQPKPYSRKEIRELWQDLADQHPYAKGARYAGDPRKQQERAEYFLARWQRGQSKWLRVRPLATRLQMEAVIALALYGGLRRAEIYALSVDDCHPDNEYVVVTGAAKNRDGVHLTRAVPWTTNHMRLLVARWLRVRDTISPPHDRLLLSLWGEAHYTDPLPFKRFEMLLTNLGRGWEFHRLRHTAATEMLRSGYELERVQKILGHSSLEMTLRYAKIVPDDIIATAAKRESQLSSTLAPPDLLAEIHGES